MVSTITNKGLNLALHRTFSTNPTQSAVCKFQVGIASRTPSITDTSLVQVIPFNTTTFNSCDTTTGWTKRGNADDVIVLSSAGSFKEGTGCLTLPTNASGSSSWYRTFTSANYDSRHFYIYYYNSNVTTNLQNVSNSVSVTLGNNSTNSNANTYEFNRSEFDNGWNVMTFYTPTTSSITGTCTLSAITYADITVLTNNSNASNNQRMDYWNHCATSDLTNTFVSGYPNFDTSSRKVTNRGFLNSLQGNSFLVKEWGMVNSDSTQILYCRDNSSSGISKTDDDEFAFIWTDIASNG